MKNRDTVRIFSLNGRIALAEAVTKKAVEKYDTAKVETALDKRAIKMQIPTFSSVAICFRTKASKRLAMYRRLTVAFNAFA